MKFERLSDHICKLGESPFWWEKHGELLYVDVHAGEICAWSPKSGTRRRRVTDRVTFIMPTLDDGFLLGLRHGIGALENFDAPLDGDIQPSIEVEADWPTTSVNDARADHKGRLWFGTLERSKREPICGLYRWTPTGGLSKEVDGVALSNGIQWSPDGATMYFVDSHTQRLDAFEYDMTTGETGRRWTVAEIAPEDGMPDGINVDADGLIYVALYGGGQIHRYRPDGRLERAIKVPVRYPSSLTFGGDDLRTLYVTSSSVGHHGSGGERPEGMSDLDGAVLVAQLDAAGTPSIACAARTDEFPRP
jgi:sugar lactone lactonase YvrE